MHVYVYICILKHKSFRFFFLFLFFPKLMNYNLFFTLKGWRKTISNPIKVQHNISDEKYGNHIYSLNTVFLKHNLETASTHV